MRRKKRRRTNRAIGGQVFQRPGRTGPDFPWFIRFSAIDPETGERVRTCRTAMIRDPDAPDGFRPAGTAAEAETALAAATAEVRKREAESGSNATFEEFRERYRPRGTSERHRRIVAAQLERAARAAGEFGGNLGAYPMRRVGRTEAQQYVEALRAGGAGPATVRRHLAALSGCWEAAIVAGVAADNPWRIGRLQLPAVPAPKIRFRPPSEVAQIVACAPVQIRPLVQLIAATGCRYSEAAGLRWSEVSDDLSRVTIPGDRTKTRTIRHIRVENDARSVLEERRAACKRRAPGGDDHVFALRPATKSRPARVFSQGYSYKLLAAALERAGIPSERPFHTLRNSLASRMVLAGVPLSVVAEAIGDSLATTAKHYGHLVPHDAVSRAYQALSTPVPRRATAKPRPRSRRPARR